MLNSGEHDETSNSNYTVMPGDTVTMKFAPQRQNTHVVTCKLTDRERERERKRRETATLLFL